MSDDEMLDIGKSVLGQLRGLQVHIDQIGTEYLDPETTPERKAQLQSELRQWYEVLTEIYQEKHRD